MELAHDPQTQKNLMPDGSTPALTSVTFQLPQDATDQVSKYMYMRYANTYASYRINLYTCMKLNRCICMRSQYNVMMIPTLLPSLNSLDNN